MKYLFFFTLFINFLCHAIQQAVISVPVADLIGSPIATVRPNESIETAYNNLAVCAGQIVSSYACPRLHQLLYNDRVEVIKTTQNEVCIATNHAFYLTPSSSEQHTQYWTLKKNITLIDDLINKNISESHIPHQITFTNNENNTHSHTATLKKPHYCTLLKAHFSAGTRFVCVPTTQQNSSLSVYVIDYKTMKEHHIKIPRKKCILNNSTQTHREQISEFITLLKEWTHTKNGFIPYVWGGTSFTYTINSPFKEVTQTTDNSDYSIYVYTQNNNSLKNGFDCSGIILRAAQICGIPYFCKNTTTITQCLKPLEQEQTLKEGDLILIKGHVMVVSDIPRNMLIEARSYSHGYGKVHEIQLSKVFEGIKTYKDLCTRYYNKQPIQRKDKFENIRDTFAHLQLLSMESVWNNKK